MLSLTGISKTYADHAVLQDVSLEIPGGTTCCLIGPSGCGKSTLLRIMIGLVQPDAGHVYVDKERLPPEQPGKFRDRFGYVIQQGGLFPHLTCRDNVRLPAEFHRWSSAEMAARITELAELTELPEAMLDRFPAQLSGGQRQRVSLIRALMLRPKFLLLDEPLGALDPVIRSQLQKELKNIFQQLEATVVMVTHDLLEAAWFSQHLVLINAGRIVQQGSLATLVDDPAEPFVEAFTTAQRHLHQFAGGAP